MSATMCMWRSEDTVQEPVPLSTIWVLRTEFWLFCGKHGYLLSHLNGPHFF